MARFGPSRKNIVPQQPVSRGPLICGPRKSRPIPVPWQFFTGQTRGPGPTAISTFGYYTYVTFGHLCSVTIFVFLVLLVKCPLLKKRSRACLVLQYSLYKLNRSVLIWPTKENGFPMGWIFLLGSCTVTIKIYVRPKMFKKSYLPPG